MSPTLPPEEKKEIREENPARIISVALWVMLAIPVAVISSAITYYSMQHYSVANCQKMPQMTFLDKAFCHKN